MLLPFFPSGVYFANTCISEPWNQPGPAGGLLKATAWASVAHVVVFSPHFPGAHEHWDRPQLVREEQLVQGEDARFVFNTNYTINKTTLS